jgi:FkbM family methyltransferase
MKSKIKKIARLLLPKLYAYLAVKYAYLGARKKRISVEKFKKNCPNTKIFEMIEQKNRKLYSQHDQDYLVYENFFKGKKDGFFCDIGGNHPLKINNTLYFEELGWSGFAFEPLPHMTKQWEEYRKAKLFPFALSDVEEDVAFTIIHGENDWEDMLSYVDSTAMVDYEYKKESIIVKTKLLKKILDSENITHVDYMSIDVEGHEINVLKGIDFNRVRVNVITIENSFGGAGDKRHYGDDEVRNILFQNDFILWGRIIGLDDIFVHKDFLKALND